MIKHLNYHSNDSKEGIMIFNKKERIVKIGGENTYVKGNQSGLF